MSAKPIHTNTSKVITKQSQALVNLMPCHFFFLFYSLAIYIYRALLLTAFQWGLLLAADRGLTPMLTAKGALLPTKTCVILNLTTLGSYPLSPLVGILSFYSQHLFSVLSFILCTYVQYVMIMMHFISCFTRIDLQFFFFFFVSIP